MYCFFYKAVKYGVFVILPLLLISSSSKVVQFKYSHSFVNKEGLVPSDFDFEVGYENVVGQDKFKKLRLRFKESDTDNSLELLLRSKYHAEEGKIETFKFNPIEGFLEGFEGVFGVFINERYGEKPFFANEGFVQIESFGNNKIQGYMDLTLENDSGKKIRISDSFRNF